MLTEKNRKKKKKFFTLFLFVLFAFLLFNFFSAGHNQASAASSLEETAAKVDAVGTGFLQTVIGAFANPLFMVFNALLYVVFGLMGILLIIAGVLFDWAINPANFEAVMKMQSIYQAWTIVRDFLNLAFILVLLYSAFCTVLQIEKYHLKKMILILVLMALLVNFSFPVARFVIDTSNVTMYFIIGKAFPWLSETSGLSTSLIQFSAIIFTLVPGASCSDSSWLGKIGCLLSAAWKNAFDAQHVTVQLLGAIIFMFLLAITLLVIGVLLIIRIVVLAILVIFSPVGFVAPIFPSTKNFGDMWWSNLFKQAFFGPVMAFMLYIALFMMKEIQEKDVGGMANFIKQNLNESNPYSNLIVSGVMMTIPIVLLWTGLIAAQKIGAAGASAVIGKASSIAKWPAAFAGKAIGYGVKSGLRKFERDALVESKWAKRTAAKVGLESLSPRAFIEGWKQRSADVEKRIMGRAAGSMQDKLNWRLGKEKTNYKQLAIDRYTMEKMKETRETSENSDFLNSKMVNLFGDKSKATQAYLKSIFRIEYGNNDQDEIMKFFKKNLDKEDLFDKDVQSRLQKELGLTGEHVTLRDLGFDEKNTTVSNKNVSNAVKKILRLSGVDESEVMKELMDLGEVAAPKGGIGYGNVEFDSDTKDFRIIDEVENPWEEGKRGYYSIAKLRTIGEAQQIPKLMHRNNFTDEAGNLNEEGKAALRIYASPSAIEHIGRHKVDFYPNVGGDEKISSQMYQYAADLKEGKAEGYDPKYEFKDPKTGKVRVGGYRKNLQDEDQAKMAVAWTASLQGTAGVAEEKIKESVESTGFTWKEIKPLAKIARPVTKGKEKEAKTEEAKTESGTSSIVDQYGRPIRKEKDTKSESSESDEEARKKIEEEEEEDDNA